MTYDYMPDWADFRISDLRGMGRAMDWGVIDCWGRVIAQFDQWDDAQMFRTAKADAAKAARAT